MPEDAFRAEKGAGAPAWYDSDSMSAETYDAVVVGAGVMGSAAAWHLARDGKRVLLLEQFEVGHNRGSSHGESRIFRIAHTGIAYARLAIQSKGFWRELERAAGEPLLRETGGLDFADDAEGYGTISAIARTLEAMRRPFEKYDWAHLSRRYPQWRMMEGVVAVFSPEDGVLNATRCVHALAAQAAAHGCELHEREPVLKILSHPDGAEIVTQKATYRASRLILTAGAWAKELLKQVGLVLPLTVTQEQTVYFRPKRNPESFRAGRLPVWIHYRKTALYGFPVLEKPGMKVAFHHEGPAIEVGEYTQTPRAEATIRLRAYLEKFMPDAAGESFEPETCLYTNTPDQDFIVDTAPGMPHIVVGSPCSGHGFKFAAGIGRALADLAERGASDLEIGHLRLARFQRRST